jgi:hypothetical protein
MTFGPPLDPPEGPEPCDQHGWEPSDDDLVDECPYCLSLHEDYEEERAMEAYYERKYGS